MLVTLTVSYLPVLKKWVNPANKLKNNLLIAMPNYVVEELVEQLVEGLECFDHERSVECDMYGLNKSYIVKE